MDVAATVLGVLGLCSVLVGIPKFKPALFFGGGAASVTAVVLWFIAPGASTAGLVCGVLGALVFAAVLLFFTMVKPGK